MKERKKLYLSLIVVLLLICGCELGSDSEDASSRKDMSGVWEGSMIPKKRKNTQIRLELTQHKSDISGQMTLSTHQSDDVTGSVEGSKATISAMFPAKNGGQVEFAYEGTVEGNTFSGTFTHYKEGNMDDEGTFSLSRITPGPDSEFGISFQWGNIPLCTSGSPNTVDNPRFVLSNVPEGTVSIEFSMTDLNVPTYDHGGGTVRYNGQNVIEPGAFEYKSPCPPDGTHRYEWTATAKSNQGDTLGKAKAIKDYPDQAQLYEVDVHTCFKLSTASVQQGSCEDEDSGDIHFLKGGRVDIDANGNGIGSEIFCLQDGTYYDLESVPSDYADCDWMRYVEGSPEIDSGLENTGMIVRDTFYKHHYKMHIVENDLPKITFEYKQID